MPVTALPVIGMGELDNPLVYSLHDGQPCQVDDLLRLVDVGQGFEALRECLPAGRSLLAWPLTDGRRHALGVNVLIGTARQLRDVHGDPLWQALAGMHEQLFARLREQLEAVESVRYERSVRQAHEAEKDKAGARRLLAAEFVGVSDVACKVREEMFSLADSSLSTLITGETGVGKDHAAWLIHQASSRSGRFVPVNCAAIPKDLIEAELFGSTRGAFTGATQTRTGLVAEADGGTLFLDEIGDMPYELQGRLLRVLNEKKYRPLGATRERESDFRLICATHQPLAQLIRDGRFREDLYFRIRQHNLHLLPLRERLEDIEPLVAHTLLQFNRERQAAVAGIEPEALALLQAHGFPGNVRELRSLVLAAAERTPRGALVGVDVVRERLAHLDGAAGGGESRPELNGLLEGDSLPEAVEAFEKLMIDTRLRQFEGSRSQAAQSLGIPKRTLARKCQQWNLDRETCPS
ncbi:sigma 54-interacting transcriptional regulator [Zestomonas carbonaria]|nr:sigma-54 dependent transcriptional regulator [Pseudomonas carbonaria]